MAQRVSEYASVRDFFASTTVVILVDIAFLLLFLILITVLAGWLVLVPLVGIAVMALVGFSLQKRMRKAAVDSQADSSLQHSMLVESIGGIETLKAAGAEGQMLGRWRRYASMSAATSGEYAPLEWRCDQHGVVVAAIDQRRIADRRLLSVQRRPDVDGRDHRDRHARRPGNLAGRPARLPDHPRPAGAGDDGVAAADDGGRRTSAAPRCARSFPKSGSGRSNCRKVSFTYPEASAPSLSDIDLKIAPGERIGIIGRVASGKSTLGRVLCGLYEPSAGVMTIDGLDSRQYHPHQVRESFRFVGQDAELFSGIGARQSVARRGRGR